MCFLWTTSNNLIKTFNFSDKAYIITVDGLSACAVALAFRLVYPNDWRRQLSENDCFPCYGLKVPLNHQLIISAD